LPGDILQRFAVLKKGFAVFYLGSRRKEVLISGGVGDQVAPFMVQTYSGCAV
jgi:hypothetical protein